MDHPSYITARKDVARTSPWLEPLASVAMAALLVSCAATRAVDERKDSDTISPVAHLAEPQPIAAMQAATDSHVTSQVAAPVPQAAALPVEVRAKGRSHASLTPIDYADPKLKCYQFLTHAQADKSAPYQADAGERLLSFTFDAPWTEAVYVRSIAPISDSSDNELRAWLLFREGKHLPEAGPEIVALPDRSGATLLHAWTAGAGAIYLDEDLGMKLPADVSYSLEAHIAVEDDRPGTHHSGAELCVTTTKPEHLVELAWLGTEAIAGTSAVGSCALGHEQPLHLIAALPRMQSTGKHMRVELDRAAAGKSRVYDADFSPGKQSFVLLDEVVMPGERIDTTCSYAKDARGGVSITDEQCQFYALYWSDGPVPGSRSFVGDNACLD